MQQQLSIRTLATHNITNHNWSTRNSQHYIYMSNRLDMTVTDKSMQNCHEHNPVTCEKKNMDEQIQLQTHICKNNEAIAIKSTHKLTNTYK